MTFGDVLLVPFPYADQTETKRRPAVLVSSDEYNAARRDRIVFAISSHPRLGLFGETPIKEWQAAGLMIPSFYKPIVLTVDFKLVIRRLGRLQGPDLHDLRTLLGRIFAP